MTQHKQSHRIKSHGRTSHQPTLHQNRSHHHHGTAEGSFTAKTWFGHRAGRSPCAHSIGKFFLCYIVLFSCETSAPGSPGNYLYDLFSFPSLFVAKTWKVSQNKNSPNGLIHSRSACFNFQTICPVKFQHATLKNSDRKFTKYILLVTACLFQIPAV